MLWYTEFSFASEASFAFERQLTMSLVAATPAHGESRSFMCCARHGAGVISKIKSVNKEEAHNWTFCFRLMAESYHDGPVPTSAIMPFHRT
jgi:hypothetical protein